MSDSYFVMYDQPSFQSSLSSNSDDQSPECTIVEQSALEYHIVESMLG